jgi:drug/metabolite transporter (DMT)-like permease
MVMFAERIGEFAALGTALCWTITALSFESAGRRIGSLAVNIIRLAIAVVLFAVYGLVVRGHVVPVDAPLADWAWLAISGLVGFVIGDLLLFQAFVVIGARVSMLIYSSVPPLTAILAYLFLDESLGLLGIAGMALTIAGIVMVVLRRATPGASRGGHGPDNRGGLGWFTGVSLAFGGALGQAGGLILGRIGAGRTMDAFAATQIRAIAGVIGFAVVFTVAGRWRNVLVGVRDRPAMVRLSFGAFFGPFVGVSLGLFAAQNTSAGVASTIMALVPVLIIVPSVLLFRERVSTREVLGALVAVSGVALLFL